MVYGRRSRVTGALNGANAGAPSSFAATSYSDAVRKSSLLGLRPTGNATVGVIPTTGTVLVRGPRQSKFVKPRRGEIVRLRSAKGPPTVGIFQGGVFGVTQASGVQKHTRIALRPDSRGGSAGWLPSVDRPAQTPQAQALLPVGQQLGLLPGAWPIRFGNREPNELAHA